jgi:dedicator of cytokinesis protein 3
MADSSGRLSEILRHEATLLEHIITDQRYYSDYFRVAFYGNFPAAIRGKQFIVRLPFALPKLRLMKVL